MDRSVDGNSISVRSFGKYPDLLVASIWVLLAIPWLASSIASFVWPYVEELDPDQAFLWASTHLVVQLLLTLLFMKLYSNGPLAHWGFNLNEWRFSLKVFGQFSVYCLLFVVLSNVPSFLSGEYPSLITHPVNARNMAGYLGFEFLLSGTSEEPLFRGFLMTLLALSWTRVYHIRRVQIPLAGIWATLLFMMGHIGIDFSSWTITHFSINQQLMSLGFGLFHAIIFHRTRSLLAPILVHGYGNGIGVAALYIRALLAG